MEIVITTIFPPTTGARALSEGIGRFGGNLWVLGDRKGPADYDLPHARFVDIEQQLKLDFKLARLLPEKHYTRKNLGYLLAIEGKPEFIVETDDDNIPLPGFWGKRAIRHAARETTRKGWVNAYRYFSKERIWPRGFPLEEIQKSFEAALETEQVIESDFLIQQGLANQNPDVDAVYRLTGELPVDFGDSAPLALGKKAWCPFNSQNTTFFEAAFPLLYLPSFCTFRMTDIWRSFVAQRCLWEMDSKLLFSQATVYQDRNEHNLLRDFEDEIPGYLNNERIKQVLEPLKLTVGRERRIVCQNLLACYEALFAAAILPEKERPLVEAWVSDLLGLS